MGCYLLEAVVQCPDGLLEVDSLGDGVARERALGDCRGDCRLEKVHKSNLDVDVTCVEGPPFRI